MATNGISAETIEMMPNHDSAITMMPVAAE